ncbi:hypothetical protein ACHHYP_11735 [Achlya hypogyna]|uniref:Uncharacterized protein n=1 Tax=Achlya hypogyna TaxID=1202772 RepID=A0A1V9YIJ1_ACHHY|nr:hypothetical protein ACHHYP_11735 [Achlya hypogyna]
MPEPEAADTPVPPPAPASARSAANGEQPMERERGDLLLIMEVVIGDGRTETIHIHRYDHAAALAAAFARTHGLSAEVEPTLVEHIGEQVRAMGLALEAAPPPPPAVEPKESQYLAMMDKYRQPQQLPPSAFSHLKPSKPKAPTKSSAPPAACDRLHALAQARDEWRAREQKRKEDAEMREIQTRQLRLADKSKALVANRTNGGHRTIGARLHSEALTEVARRDKLAAARQQEKEAAIDWMCPKCAFFNKHTDKACQNPRTKRAPASVAKAKSSTARVCGQPKPALFQPTRVAAAPVKKGDDGDQVLARRHRHEQMAQTLYHSTHTFAPRLNPNSQDIVREKRGADARDPHATLYDDASARRQKQLEKEAAYLAQFPFKPDIGLRSHAVPATDWVTRLAVLDNTAEKRRELLSKHGAAVDPATGRPLFTPEVGRAPLFPRNDTGLPIGDFLYESRHELNGIKKQLQANAQAHQKAQQTQSFMSSTSRNLLEARKARSFRRIFDLLLEASGEAEREELSPARVPLDSLPAELAHVAQSLVDAVGFAPIPRAAFHAAMETTLTSSPGLTHTQVLFFSDKPTPIATAEQLAAAEAKDLTFCPKINAPSGRVERRKDVDVFEALHKYHATYEAKRRACQAKYDRALAEACPFKPQLVAKPHNCGDMYALLPDDDAFNDADAVVLQTSKPLARPYVRPIDEEPGDEGSPIHVNRSPVGPIHPRLLMVGEIPPPAKSPVRGPPPMLEIEAGDGDGDDDEQEGGFDGASVHPLGSSNALKRSGERPSLLASIVEEKEAQDITPVKDEDARKDAVLTRTKEEALTKTRCSPLRLLFGDGAEKVFEYPSSDEDVNVRVAEAATSDPPGP